MPHSRPALSPLRLASRRRAAVLLLLALAALSAFVILPRLAGAARDDRAAAKTPGPEFVPGEVLVRFSSESKAEERSFAVEELGVPGAVLDPREVIATQLALWSEAGAAAILLWGWPIFPGAEDNYTERWTHESVDQVAAVIRDFPA